MTDIPIIYRSGSAGVVVEWRRPYLYRYALSSEEIKSVATDRARADEIALAILQRVKRRRGKKPKVPYRLIATEIQACARRRPAGQSRKRPPAQLQPTWCGEHHHRTQAGAQACQRARLGIEPRERPDARTFCDESRKEIAAAVAKAIDLKNNPHKNQSRHDLVIRAVHTESGPQREYVRNAYHSNVLDPAFVSFFIARLELEASQLVARVERRKTMKRKRGQPRKVEERRFAARVALLCRDLLEIEPTKSREQHITFFAERGGFFFKVLRVSFEGAGLNPPKDMFRLIGPAVDALHRLARRRAHRGQADASGFHQHLKQPEARILKQPEARLWRYLDSLKGVEYETALAALSPEQEQRYLIPRCRVCGDVAEFQCAHPRGPRSKETCNTYLCAEHECPKHPPRKMAAAHGWHIQPAATPRKRPSRK